MRARMRYLQLYSFAETWPEGHEEMVDVSFCHYMDR
jgi:hypothetical protein